MIKAIQYVVWYLALNAAACAYFPHKLTYPKFILLELVLVVLAQIMVDK